MLDIDKIIKKKRCRLLPILEEVQKELGYLPKSSLKEISKKLNIPLVKIYGVATFYFLFDIKKRGKYVIKVCKSPTCYLHGSTNILEILKKVLKTDVGGTSKNKKFSLELTSCIGCCDKPPAMMINDKVHRDLTEEKIKKIIKKLK